MPNDPGKARRRALVRAMQQAAMAELMAVAAHEVNQPLAAMVANAGAGVRWLGREPADTEEARAAFQRIAEDGRRAGDLLRRIRAQASRAPASGDRVLDARAIVDAAWSAATELADTDGIVLELRVAPGDIGLRGDEAALQLAFLNLITNALDAMGPGGTLTIEASPVGQARVAIAVHDTGPGFPAQDAERMFLPFHSTRGGLGIGLPLARAIAEAHGGNLEARREAGRTTFTLFFPTALRAP